VRAEPAIRNPRTRVKPKWTPSRRSWRIPSHSDRAAPSRIYKTLAANSRLQVRPRSRTLMSCLLMKIGKISAGRPVLPRFWFATNRQGRLAPMGWGWLYSPCDDLRWQVTVSATNIKTFIPRTELWYREYDISINADEPQQTISFMPERRASRSFLAQDSTEREVASFTLGKGAADWGPLTVYALTKSGDIYSFCPYLPKNAYVMPDFIAAAFH